MAQDKEKQTSSLNDCLKKKNVELQQQVERLKKDAETNKKASKQDPSEPSRLSDDSRCKELGDQLQAKIKEVYGLTVELGCIREENNELNKNIDMQKDDFQERLHE